MELNKVDGLRVSRLNPKAGNPREVAFAETWKKQDRRVPIGLLEVPCESNDPECVGGRSGFGNGPFKLPVGPCTERDEIVIATVIQWLGSNCGMSMLGEALRRCGYRICKEDGTIPGW